MRTGSEILKELAGHTALPWTVTKYGYEKYSVNGKNGIEICGAWNGDFAEFIATAGNNHYQLKGSVVELLEIIHLAIGSGDWKVDGACDPDAAIQRALKAIKAAEQ